MNSRNTNILLLRIRYLFPTIPGMLNMDKGSCVINFFANKKTNFKNKSLFIMNHNDSSTVDSIL